MSKPFFPNQAVAVVVGGALFVAGSWCLYDAWERRGDRTPWFFRPFSWW